MSELQPGFDPEQSEQEPGKSEKEIAWDKMRATVDTIGDGLGKGIDENIKESVTTLLVYGFPTEASCEGHAPGEEEGNPFPWIEVMAKEPEAWQGDEKIEREWTESNLKERQKMLNFLAEFNPTRESQTPYDARLTFRNVGAFGAFAIQSVGAELVTLYSPEEQKQKRDLYRKEMKDFTNFLKEKYLQG